MWGLIFNGNFFYNVSHHLGTLLFISYLEIYIHHISDSFKLNCDDDETMRDTEGLPSKKMFMRFIFKNEFMAERFFVYAFKLSTFKNWEDVLVIDQIDFWKFSNSKINFIFYWGRRVLSRGVMQKNFNKK